jgi:oligopeptide transport system ATP-binding protein
MKKVLDIKNLSISFNSLEGKLYAINNIDFSLFENEIVAIVGESGSGKTTLMQSILKLHSPEIINYTQGNIFFENKDLLQLKEKEIRKIRGKKISMVFQDSMSSLNPTITIGDQILESLENRKKETVFDLLKSVGIQNEKDVYKAYPHELSGGMRQRVMIAIAIAKNPKIIICDEPTTSLDVTIQDQILNLLKDLNSKKHISIILITHDLSIVSKICKKVFVMYAGKIVEEGLSDNILLYPKHPYTQLLIKAIPSIYKNTKLSPIEGSPPNLLEKIDGCPFLDRCPFAMVICKKKFPKTVEFENQKVRCFLYDK